MKGGKCFVGSIHSTTNGVLEVTEYLSSTYRRVRFLDTGYVRRAHTFAITSGNIKDLMRPSVYGVGYYGDGKHKGTKVRGSNAKYESWSGMLERCYSTNYHSSHRYKGKVITVCEEWKNFQVYGDWFDKNYVKGFELDKDILFNGTYSPSSCRFIPKPLNTFFTSRYKERGKHPVGVCDHSSGRLSADMNDGTGKTDYLGLFDCPYEAFAVYKEAKESLAKQYAGDYFSTGVIDVLVYNTLLDWEAVPFPD